MQELSEINGGSSSYEQYVGGRREDRMANPDVLPKQKSGPSTPQLLMGEAIQHLQGRQKEVYIAIMRDEKSTADVGKMLQISKSTVRTYLDRAIDFISAYCKQAIDKERV